MGKKKRKGKKKDKYANIDPALREVEIPKLLEMGDKFKERL